MVSIGRRHSITPIKELIDRDMRKFQPLFIALVISSLLSSGCTGLKMWEKGDYFQSDVAKDFDVNEVRRVGVYVYSNGEAIDGTSRPFDVTELLEQIVLLPVQLLSGSFTFGGPQIGFTTKFYPSKVTTETVMETDTSNAGPSLELANKIKSKLNEFGYLAETITDLGHDGDISVEQCIVHARENRYDAAFVVYYSGLSRWTKFAGTSTRTTYDYVSGTNTTINTTHVDVFNGYLYLPNTTMFATESGKVLWKNWYYGVYENAHIINLAGEEFTAVANSVIYPMADEDYFKASTKAVETIFAPTAWPDSFTEFPKRGDRKGKM